MKRENEKREEMESVKERRDQRDSKREGTETKHDRGRHRETE